MNPQIFQSSETSPEGIRVTTTITVPEAAQWPDIGDAAEQAQMGTSYTARRVAAARKQSLEHEECPF